MSKARLLRLPEVLSRTGLSRSGLYERMKNGGFPKKVKLDPNGTMVAWIEEEVDEWINQRIRHRV
jgi:prophage regulatory protein